MPEANAHARAGIKKDAKNSDACELQTLAGDQAGFFRE
jgi:hypothetical protein